MHQPSSAATPQRLARSHAEVIGQKPRGIQGRVISRLGEEIVRGVYPTGSLLPRESELMAAYAVSRTSIREGIKVLSAKGLVETRQRIGTRVLDRSNWNIFDPDVLLWHPFDGAEHDILHDLIEMRQLVEPAAARFAATRATLDDLALIRASCDAMRDILARQEFNEEIPAGLPPGTKVAHKTGWITGVLHDAAVVYPPNRKPYVLVVLTRDIPDEEVARRLIADVSRLVWTQAVPTASQR